MTDAGLMTNDNKPLGNVPARRSTSDRMVAGVAAGIATRLQAPPWVIRLTFVVLTVFGGVGVPLYVIGWLLLPEEGSDESHALRLARKIDGSGQ